MLELRVCHVIVLLFYVFSRLHELGHLVTIEYFLFVLRASGSFALIAMLLVVFLLHAFLFWWVLLLFERVLFWLITEMFEDVRALLKRVEIAQEGLVFGVVILFEVV